ncbi:MAG: carboxypeptidase regulatory-like domain-containing protein [Silvibacterium sp.]|nr:carboxypeptidase regulatory-like domain-containing protein [Silvibacterium sp.]
MTFRLSFCAIILCLSAVAGANGQDISAPEPQSGVIVGTALDVNGNPIPGARIALEGPLPADRQQAVTNENGFFELSDVRAGVPCHVTIAASGFADWNSPEVTLRAGQYLELTGINLKLGEVVTTVYATSSSDEIATEQVQIAEHQRVLGVVPNFYVTYDPHPVALTPGLKFRLALRALTDPVTFLGAATVAGMDQAADKFDFQQDAKGYFQRFGASYANMFTDIMVGGAVLPSLLHQDPRYIYQGTGTTKARALHAISYPFITRGDNGHRQPNYSNLGGVLASGAIANAYYPASNRGPGLVLNTAVIDICTSMANGLLQEFVFRRLTPSAKERVSSSVSGKASSSRSGN